MASSSQMMLLALLACCSIHQTAAARVRITPVQQVLKLLGEMKAKAEVSMEVEKKTYATYKEWVDDRSQELGFEIQTGKSDIEKLTAFIEKADSKIGILGNEIGALDADIARMEGEKKDATTVRKDEHEEYAKLSQDYSESVEALEQAIQVLSAQNYDRPQAMALLQRMEKSQRGMNRVLAALAQHEQSQSVQDGAPAVAAYEFQSDNILKVMNSLLDKFKAELAAVEEDESNQAHYYDLTVLHLSDTITKASSDRADKAALKSKTAAASAKAKGELAETKRELAADEATLAEIKATFASKSQAFAENQEVRKGELEALQKAIEILSTPEVVQSYAEHVKLAQVSSRTPSTPGFIQLRSARHRLQARDRAVALLRRRANALSSKDLQSLAIQLQANPFSKVIGLIEDLLERLKAEAAAEADHKAWCDKELKSNKLKREKKSSKVEELTAEIEGLGAEITTMGEDITTLVEEQAELTKAMGEATSQRETEKSTNLDTIADAQAGAAAVKKALVVLQEFYSAQSAPEALLQEGHKQVPEMEAYKGLQGRKKGVLGLLEVIQTDFMRLEAETKAAEDQAAREYASFMKQAKADSLQKHNREVKLRLDKDQTEFVQSQTKKDLDSNAAVLAQANKYYDYLKPNCLEVHVNYEERVQKRKEEIAALKEAYAILDSKSKSSA